jgi:uncharacterized SAM-binding protein YcdF (DUF218 family)
VAIRVAVGVAVAVLLWIGMSYQVVQNPTVVEHPSAADAIVVLGPATDDRIAEAVTLARQSVSHVIVVSNEWSHRSAMQLCANPPSGWTLLCFIPSPDTTRGEAEYVRNLVSARGWSNLAVVTSRYHISRARLIIKRCFTGRLQMVAAPESINPAQWLYQYFYQSAGYLRAAVTTSC